MSIVFFCALHFRLADEAFFHLPTLVVSLSRTALAQLLLVLLPLLVLPQSQNAVVAAVLQSSTVAPLACSHHRRKC
eukprot:COSAG02_NODE_11696_length_1672_cov_2.403687_1_plen_75_part_10